MNAGGAGCRNGEIRALCPKSQRQNARGGVKRDGRDKVRVDPMWLTRLIEGGEFTFSHHHATHAHAGHDSYPFSRLLLKV